MGALQQAWRVGRRDYPLFLLLWLPALALEVAVALLVAAYERAQGFAPDAARMTTGEQMELLGVALPLYLALATLRLALWTLVAARVLDRVRGGRRLAGWTRLAAPALAAGFVLVLTYTAGLLLVLVGFLVFLHWFLFVPAMLANGARGVGAAFEQSRRFARERSTPGFTALVVLVGGAVFAAYLAAGALPGVAGLLGAPIVAWLGGPLVPLLAASFVALAQEERTRPAPEAQAAPPRATTTCPACRTLFAYTPTGGPVDVTCPSCGRSGKVL